MLTPIKRLVAYILDRHIVDATACVVEGHAGETIVTVTAARTVNRQLLKHDIVHPIHKDDRIVGRATGEGKR